jgi:hypothetical protein
MSRLVTKEHSYADILKGSIAPPQNQKNPTHEKPGKYHGYGVIF